MKTKTKTKAKATKSIAAHPRPRLGPKTPKPVLPIADKGPMQA